MSSIIFHPAFYKPYPGIKVNESKHDQFLASLAQNHAEFMAKAEKQGHQNWDKRYQNIRKHFKQSLKAQEVCAESWKRQWNDPLNEIVRDACRSWHHSAGHWQVVSQKHDLFGDGICRSLNGIYYTCVIVVDFD